MLHFSVPGDRPARDTGALVTGMTNEAVARYLLHAGLPEMDGVVFLDADDRQQILLRPRGPLRDRTYFLNIFLKDMSVSEFKRASQESHGESPPPQSLPPLYLIFSSG